MNTAQHCAAEAPALNRAMRRHLKQAARKPPAPRRKPGQVMANATDVVKARATRLTDAERAGVLQPARDGFKALREGVATFKQWVDVNTAIAVAMAIEEQGVIRGMHEHFAAADRAIDAVRLRVEQDPQGPAWGRRTTLYFHEIEALREAIHLHDEQLRVLAACELTAAIALAHNNTRALGGRVVHVPSNATPQQIQELLL